jgi:hypothetical protein
MPPQIRFTHPNKLQPLPTPKIEIAIEKAISKLIRQDCLCTIVTSSHYYRHSRIDLKITLGRSRNFVLDLPEKRPIGSTD